MFDDSYKIDLQEAYNEGKCVTLDLINGMTTRPTGVASIEPTSVLLFDPKHGGDTSTKRIAFANVISVTVTDIEW